MASNGVSTTFFSRIYTHFLATQSPHVYISSRAPIWSRTPRCGLNSATVISSSSRFRWRKELALSLERRGINFSIMALILSFGDHLSRLLFSSQGLAMEIPELARYTDSKDGFTLLIPSSWTKVDKAGATVLFEDPTQKSNNLGVVVSPTRISNLSEFGTPQFVADKLIQAERRKESTVEAELLSVSERSGDNGVRVYEFEYSVDSTRGGLKRVFSSAFVQSKKLYLLNISFSDGASNPIQITNRSILQGVMHSFQGIPVRD